MLSDDHTKAVIEANLENMATALGLRYMWKIRVEYERLEDGTAMQTEIDLAYRRVTIQVDPSQHETGKEVLEHLRHELIHVLFWPFHLYREHYVDMNREPSDEARKEQELWTFAVENMVVNVDEMLKQLEPDEYRLLSKLKPMKKKEPSP